MGINPVKVKNIDMKHIPVFFLVAFLFVTASSCQKTEPGAVKATGILRKQGASAHQCGTHVLIDANGQLLYALRSRKANLDKYDNKSVEIKGRKIKGYPVDGGPDYLEVSQVKE